MGYPVKYRTQAARQERVGSQARAPGRSATVLQFPEMRMQGFTNTGSSKPRKKGPRGPGAAERSRPGARGPNWNPYGRINPGGGRPLSNPFGLATRQRNQRALIGAFKGGLRFRARLFSSVARFVLRQLFTLALSQMRWPQRPIQPGWVIASGRWGLSGDHGLTAVHNLGATVDHGNPPPVFNHPWQGPPFDWSEYDTVTKPSLNVWRFVVVGRGDMGTGPDPRTMNNNKSLLPGYQLPTVNPWKPGYNPSWNKHPGVWPDGMPDLTPWYDPFLYPPNMPEPLPNPIPFWALPERRQNPWRSPSEQSEWGPIRVRVRRPIERPDIEWPDLIGDPDLEPPVNRWPFDNYGRQRRDVYERGKPRRRYDPKVRRRDRKPPRRTKELKSKGSMRFAKILLAAINGLTEFNDLVNALYKAIPYRYAPPGTLLKDRWGIVYRHADKIDLGSAVREIIKNQIEDALYGRMGSTGGKGARKRGDVIDKISRSLRKIGDRDNGPEGEEFAQDPVGFILDRIFGKKVR